MIVNFMDVSEESDIKVTKVNGHTLIDINNENVDIHICKKYIEEANETVDTIDVETVEQFHKIIDKLKADYARYRI